MKHIQWTPLKAFLTIGSVLGVCTAIATAWVQMGGAVPATQQLLYETASGLDGKITRVEAQGKKHSEESAKWGRKIYSEELNKLLRIDPPQDPEQHQYWKDNVERAQRQRKFYTDKEIELRKK